MSQVHSDFVNGYRQLVTLLEFGPDKNMRWHTYSQEFDRLIRPLHDLESRTVARINHQRKEVFTHRSLWAQFIRKQLGTSPVTTKLELEGHTYYLVVTDVDKEAISKLLVALRSKLRETALENIARLQRSPYYVPEAAGPAEPTASCDWQETLLALMGLSWSETGAESTVVVPSDLRDRVAEILEGTK